MSRESEFNYGGEDDVQYMMSHMDYDVSCIEDMGDYYADNDPHYMMEHHQDFRYNYSNYDSTSMHDTMDHHQDFRYDSEYTSVHNMERYHDFEQPSSYDIGSKYTRIDDMERYHDYDHTGQVLRFLGPGAKLKLVALNVYVNIIIMNICVRDIFQ